MINPILERLTKVRRSSSNTWRACCPAHGGSNPTALTIKEEPDGRILMHCFQGCSATDVIEAIGLDIAELFPDPLTNSETPVKKPVERKFYAMDVLVGIKHECQIITLAAIDITKGQPVDVDRVRVAMERILAGMELVK